MSRSHQAHPPTSPAPRLVLALIAMLNPVLIASAQGAGWIPATEALRSTRESGIPAILLVVSPDVPHCAQFQNELLELPAIQALAARMPFGLLSTAENSQAIHRLGVDVFPTLIVYERTGEKLRVRSFLRAPRDPQSVAQWLASLGLADTEDQLLSPPATNQTPQSPSCHQDESLVRVQYPSAQQAAPEAPAKPIPVTPTQPLFTPAPAPAPTAYNLAAPAPTYVIQQPAPNIILVPAGPPNVIAAQAALPSNLMLQQAAPAPAFSPASPQSPQPTQAYALAPAYPPTTYAYAQAQPVAASPVGSAVAAFVLTNPGLVAEAIGKLGQLLAKCGQPKLKPATAIPVGTPAQAPGWALAPQQAYFPQVYAPQYFSPAPAPAYIPVPVPQPQLQPQPQPAPAPAPPPAPAPLPSPQAQHQPKHGWFHR